ncbi:MAG: STAS-like domain-containing protein [Deltaproteobacteria bacterium]|nr:STAS-like domain-containing protein [Deltaproteobacteria bacterium]
MTYARLVEMGKDLSSRERARLLREEFVREAGVNPARLTFDFAGVRTLSDSFADELLAVLVVERGEAWFREHVHLANLSPELRLVVLNAIQARLRRSSAA